MNRSPEKGEEARGNARRIRQLFLPFSGVNFRGESRKPFVGMCSRHDSDHSAGERSLFEMTSANMC
jgi:hypothetical protein